MSFLRNYPIPKWGKMQESVPFLLSETTSKCSTITIIEISIDQPSESSCFELLVLSFIFWMRTYLWAIWVCFWKPQLAYAKEMWNLNDSNQVRFLSSGELHEMIDVQVCIYKWKCQSINGWCAAILLYCLLEGP